MNAVAQVMPRYLTRAVDMDTLIEIVGEYKNAPEDYYFRDNKERLVVEPRKIAMFFATIYFNWSLRSIGESFGGRDHATVIHARNYIRDQISIDKRYKESMDNLNKIIADRFILEKQNIENY